MKLTQMPAASRTFPAETSSNNSGWYTLLMSLIPWTRPSFADNVLSINYRVFSDEILSNFRNSLQYPNPKPILNNDANESYELFQTTLLFLF